MALIPGALARGGRMVNPRLVVGVLAIVVIVVVLSRPGMLARLQDAVPGLKTPPPTYQNATVGKGNLVSSVTATGPVAAVDTVPLAFKNGGKLADLKVAQGDHVTKGQVL